MTDYVHIVSDHAIRASSNDILASKVYNYNYMETKIVIMWQIINNGCPGLPIPGWVCGVGVRGGEEGAEEVG